MAVGGHSSDNSTAKPSVDGGLPHVSDVRFSAASCGRSGLAGWVSFVIDGSLRVDGVSVRETRDGRAALSFPARRDRHGREHPYIRPLGDRARRALERQVLAALGLAEDEP